MQRENPKWTRTEVFLRSSTAAEAAFQDIKITEFWIEVDFHHKSPRRLSCRATRGDVSGVCDDCMNFLNHQNNQIIDVFLWKLSSALVHFNASQRDSDRGTDPAEQDFDTVCEKFITASATQCPVPEVIYSLRAFDILQTAALWVGAFFPKWEWGWNFLPV